MTLVMPHPGIIEASSQSANGLAQPEDLNISGSNQINASVISPALNVLCANAAKLELEPVVYETLPNAKMIKIAPGNRLFTVSDVWKDDVQFFPADIYLNFIFLNDIFKLGKKNNRQPPVFTMVRMNH